ncbi:MAG TPA: discoidin domain-containing protein, partial [Terriglobales bacterium]|nr:discoidin domain-containing protein [Terriglobales bacterium]
GNYGAVLSFDGNPTTLWHTAWCPTSPGPPHEIQINLGSSYTLAGFQYLPRQDSSDNGKIKQYEFYVSSDGTNWALVASGVLMTTSGDKSQKTVTFNAIQGQYLRLREINEIHGNPWASMAELSVLASNIGSVPDFAVSANPSAVSVPEGASSTSTIATTVVGGFNNSITLSASGMPAGVSVSFNPASFVAPGPGTSTMAITVNDAVIGTYPITVSATSGSITHTTVVPLTVTAGVIPKGSWTMKYVDSQEIICGNYGAVLSFDGNPTTLWHTAWCPTSPGPPHEIQINLGSSYTLAGFQYLPRQDSSDNGKIKQYEFYVSSDGTNWTLVASGVLMTTSGDKSQKTVTFNPIQGQYLRLREINEIHGNPWASMAELNLLYQ